MNHFCTITTTDHLYKVYALADSLKQGQEFTLHVLVVDSEQADDHAFCQFWYLKDFANDALANPILQKYKANKDKLRWSMKPVFMHHLLGQEGIDRIIYLDNDLFFYADYQFLFNELNEHSFLLTPHYYKDYPDRQQNWLEANYRVGLYNAGFVGASRQALETLKWWAACCAYRCEKNSFRGLFDDQKYLDLVPIKEEKALVLRHPGCNVAGWNMEYCKRTEENGKILINGKFPIVFIHFNDTTIREIMRGSDSILLSYYRQYVAAMKKYKSPITEITLLKPMRRSDQVKYAIWKWITDLGL